MRRLFAQKRIRSEAYGRGDRPSHRIVRAGQRPALVWDANADN
jgi:hypothetical protein